MLSYLRKSYLFGQIKKTDKIEFPLIQASCRVNLMGTRSNIMMMISTRVMHHHPSLLTGVRKSPTAKLHHLMRMGRRRRKTKRSTNTRKRRNTKTRIKTDHGEESVHIAGWFYHVHTKLNLSPVFTVEPVFYNT